MLQANITGAPMGFANFMFFANIILGLILNIALKFFSSDRILYKRYKTGCFVVIKADNV